MVELKTSCRFISIQVMFIENEKKKMEQHCTVGEALEKQ